MHVQQYIKIYIQIRCLKLPGLPTYHPKQTVGSAKTSSPQNDEAHNAAEITFPPLSLGLISNIGNVSDHKGERIHQGIYTMLHCHQNGRSQIMLLIFVVPCIMLYSSEISPRCNKCVFILRNG